MNARHLQANNKKGRCEKRMNKVGIDVGKKKYRVAIKDSSGQL
jgi:hypothetical protein